jgi:hypothetical protein
VRCWLVAVCGLRVCVWCWLVAVCGLRVCVWCWLVAVHGRGMWAASDDEQNSRAFEPEGCHTRFCSRIHAASQYFACIDDLVVDCACAGLNGVAVLPCAYFTYNIHYAQATRTTMSSTAASPTTTAPSPSTTEGASAARGQGTQHTLDSLASLADIC